MLHDSEVHKYYNKYVNLSCYFILKENVGGAHWALSTLAPNISYKSTSFLVLGHVSLPLRCKCFEGCISNKWLHQNWKVDLIYNLIFPTIPVSYLEIFPVRLAQLLRTWEIRAIFEITKPAHKASKWTISSGFGNKIST